MPYADVPGGAWRCLRNEPGSNLPLRERERGPLGKDLEADRPGRPVGLAARRSPPPVLYCAPHCRSAGKLPARKGAGLGGPGAGSAGRHSVPDREPRRIHGTTHAGRSPQGGGAGLDRLGKVPHPAAKASPWLVSPGFKELGFGGANQSREREEGSPQRGRGRGTGGVGSRNRGAGSRGGELEVTPERLLLGAPG